MVNQCTAIHLPHHNRLLAQREPIRLSDSHIPRRSIFIIRIIVMHMSVVSILYVYGEARRRFKK